MATPSSDVLSLTGYDNPYRWNAAAEVGTPTVVTYSFSTSQPDYDTDDRPGFTGFGATHQEYARDALDVWAASSGISFVEVPESVGGTIRFAMFDMTGLTNAVGRQLSGFAYYPNSTWSIGGDIYMNANYYAANAATMAPGVRGYSILLHEVGHAIGFKHPFEGDPTIDAAHDNGSYTVMSYDRPNTTVSLGSVDVEAAQYYYGTSGYSVGWDAATLTLSQVATEAGERVLGIDLADQIHALGGNDTVRSQDGDDLVGGYGGDDLLLGGSGHDTVLGDDGLDVIYGNLQTDFLNGGADADTLYGGQNDTTSGSAFGIGRDGVETLIGASGADVLYGNFGTDLLSGGADGDTLYGGQDGDSLVGGDGADALFGNLGDDWLEGGGGADLFVISSGADTIADFNAAEGDSIEGSGTYTATDGSEGAILAFSNGTSVTLIGVAAASLTDTAVV